MNLASIEMKHPKAVFREMRNKALGLQHERFYSSMPYSLQLLMAKSSMLKVQKA